MKSSESIAKLAAALVAAQAEIKAVAKDSTNPHFGSKFASLDTIIGATRPTLTKHGLAIVQGATTPHTDETGRVTAFTVETRLVHSSGEWLENQAVMPVGKADPQGAGGALTYGRRYGLSALLSLATDEDDDGNAATPRQSAQPERRYEERKPAANPAPRDTTPTIGEAAEAGAFVMPFGKSKGKPISEMKRDDLEGALGWAREKGKFVEFQAAAETYLASPQSVFDAAEVDEPLPF